MKTIVLIFLISGPILAQSTSILKDIEKRSPLESIEKDPTHITTTKDDKTKVKESKVEVSELTDPKSESSKDLYKGEPKLKDRPKLKNVLKAKDELKGNDELKLKDGLELKDLKLDKASDSKPVERAKKDCKTVAGPTASPTKICFEVTPGVQGPLEICKDDGPGFANRPQIPQESQLGPQIPQEPQFIPQPYQLNYETPQPDFQFPQLNSESPELPIFYKGPSLTPTQIPTIWCIQTETGLQTFPSIIQIDPQNPQGSVYQTQPQQQFGYPPNFPSPFPPPGFPNHPSTIPPLPPLNLPSNYPPSIFSSFPPQNFPSNYPPQPIPSSYFTFPYPPHTFPCPPPQTVPYPPLQTFPYPPPQTIPYPPPQNLPSGYSQNHPSVYSQNSPPVIQIQLQTPQVQSQQQFGYPQSLPINPPNFPNKFHPIIFGPAHGTKYEIVQPDSQGFLPGVYRPEIQGGAPPSAPGSSGGNTRPTGPAPTAEANSQNIQQQTMRMNAINFDTRRLQPGPLSRILDRPSSFQVSGQTGTMESSWGPLMIQGPRLSREPESYKKQLKNALETEQNSKSQPSRKADQSTLKISTPSHNPSSQKLRISTSQQLSQSIFPPSGPMGNQKENLQHVEQSRSAQTVNW